MRLFRAAAIVFILASALAAALIFAVSTAAGQERTPEWLFEHSHIGEAHAAAQRMVAANPRDAVGLAWLARTLTAAGDAKAAVAMAERAIAVDPRSALGHLALAEALGEEAERANIVRQLPMARRIKKALETAVAVDPRNVDALMGLIQFYLLAPGIAGGSNEKADETAARIAAIDPARGFLAQAVIAARRRQPEKIEGLYLKALEANPNSRPARSGLAGLYLRDSARQADAEAHARALLALDPALLAPYRLLAIVYARGERWRELDAILGRSDSQHPANFTAAFVAAQVLRETGKDLPRAERYIRRYLSQPPEIGMPTHAVAHWQLGLVLEKAGRRDEARAALQQAVRMDPKLEPAQKDLKRLR